LETIGLPVGILFREIYLNKRNLLSRQLALLSMVDLSDVDVLSISESGINDSEFKVFQQCHRVRWVDLSKTNVSTSSIQIIAGFVDLETLHLEYTEIDNNTMESLQVLTNRADIWTEHYVGRASLHSPPIWVLERAAGAGSKITEQR
jgi:hypothetical protein